jgi:hypothetical protein
MNSAVVKRLNEKVRHMFSEFTDDLDKMMIESDIHYDVRYKIKCYISNYQFGLFTQDDLLKRKRTKNLVVSSDRCCAKRSSGEQCTRRHKDDSKYCGTHSKGQPHGLIDEKEINNEQKKEVRAEEIKGIVYYVDDDGIVYDTEQVHQNIENPRVIGKYVKGEDGQFALIKYDM